MSISFSRSMRSLKNDSMRPSIIALIIALSILGAWGAWFAFTELPQFETSGDWQIQRDGSILAKFSPEAMTRILPGQAAELNLRVSGKRTPTTVRARVMETANRAQNRLAPETVRLALTGELPKSYEGGDVQIEVERLSPLLLVMRASGKFAGAQFASIPKQ
ncbi:MAG: hypothetical protein HY070_03245 [Chloroflexi bacterium]|nr:hypothetical protein [Chloroflexota bacterium]MBI3739144.1 hypothetical protein [Chloroflexota bacterium]